MKKIRIGPPRDGGYIIFDDLANTSSVYSFGIGTQIEFDKELAERGLPVFMFDHTIGGLPYDHPRFHFIKKGLGGVDDFSTETFSLSTLISETGNSGRNDLLAKIDVEGAEYATLIACADATLTQFRQIVVEIHWLTQLHEQAFRADFISALAKITKYFTLCHVHGNNCAPILVVDGFVVADVLELTFIRSDLVDPIPSSTYYPTLLDEANAHWAADLLLWFYPFLPSKAVGEPRNTVIDPVKQSLLSSEQTLRNYIRELDI